MTRGVVGVVGLVAVVHRTFGDWWAPALWTRSMYRICLCVGTDFASKWKPSRCETRSCSRQPNMYIDDTKMTAACVWLFCMVQIVHRTFADGWAPPPLTGSMNRTFEPDFAPKMEAVFFRDAQLQPKVQLAKI